MGEPARHTEGPRDAGHDRRPVRRGRRATALLTGLLALAGVATVPGATPAPAASSDYPAGVTITSVVQNSAAANGTVQVSGTLTNTGSSALKAPSVGLAVGRGAKALSFRGDIGSMLGRGDPSSQDGSQLGAPVKQLPDLAPGASTPFDLPAVQLGDLKLQGGNGVYELAVDVEAGTADDDSPHTVGISRTVLPYFPTPGDTQKVQTATLWPLTHAPELVPQTGQDNDEPVLRDDSLVTELGPNGRLGQLVKLGKEMPGLTWVVDPDLLDAALAMTKPYRVLAPGHHNGDPAQDGNTVAGTGTAVATEWLNQLRQAVAQPQNTVLALPYGDPDLASIAHNGGQLANLDSLLNTAKTAGGVTAEGRLSVDVHNDVAWPYQGYADPATIQVTQRLGATKVLLNGASVPDAKSLPYTPDAARPLGNGQTALVADPTIASLFQDDLKSPDRQTQAEQRFLGETLGMVQQAPSNQRTLLVMPPRDLTADTAKVIKASLAAAQNGGWLNQVPFDTVANAPADPRAGTTVAGPDAYPGDLRGSELPAGVFDQLNQVQQNEDKLLRIVTKPLRVIGPFSSALERSLSTQWRGTVPAGVAYRANVQGYLDQLVDAVLIPKKSKTITLAGDSGVLQVSVRNGLQQPVTNLELRLTSAQPNRLKVTNRQSITLDPAQSTSARFQAQALGNGAVVVTAQLFTVGPDGAQPYSAQQQFTVQVTSVPSGVWWVVGAGALLVLAAGLRIFLQRRKRGDEPPEDPDAPLTDPEGPEGAEADQEQDEEAEGDWYGRPDDPSPPSGQGHPQRQAAAHP
ncbi:hypothetical protein [Kitasatospora viridis]|uniref:Uncharacterized protein n=1 Tax=Kitasatospora viridis TaxID=281105 RepID=A0A561UHI0_9ACTN|nr:hypothetical protein [Kitasatospora viridis]TWF98818.1 hypothetical protein FHX73_112645 [Kitasatospora viridis]